jgi:type IV pilus assembly protein PilM
MCEGVCTDPVGVAEAVRGLVFPTRVRRLRVAAAVSGPAVIVKRVCLPAMPDAELREAMCWEAEQYIACDLSEVQIDYHVVATRGGAAAPSIDVLLVAARRDRIEDRTAVIAQAGCEAAVLDVEACALANAYALNYPERQDPLALLIHVGRRSTVICLLEQGQLVFTRDISFGGQAHTDALVREWNVDEATADRRKHSQDFAASARDPAAAILRDVTTRIVAEITKTIDGYRASAPLEPISRIVLSGGACGAPGLAELLATECSAPVETCDPFRRIRTSKNAAPAIAAASFAVAVGLALRQERAA